MASGWCGDNAVNDQIASSIADEVERIRNNLPQGGNSLRECEECGQKIPEARRAALPGVRVCVECQEEFDRVSEPLTVYNRKANKSSQLR